MAKKTSASVKKQAPKAEHPDLHHLQAKLRLTLRCITGKSPDLDATWERQAGRILSKIESLK